MTTSSSDPWVDPPRVSPHSGTEVWPPDALGSGVSPRWKGLGMAEPSRSDPLNRRSNFVRTAPSCVSCREEFAWLRNILQEVFAGQRRVVLLPGEAGIGKTQEPQELRSGALRHGLQVGFDRGYGELISLSLPFVEISQAMLDPPSLEIERTLSINLQDRVELHYWA